MTQPTPGEPGFVPPGGINCQSCTELFIDYVEGIMPPGQLSSFEEHNRGCVACRTYLANYQKVKSLASKVGASEAGEPAAVSASTIAAILGARKNMQG